MVGTRRSSQRNAVPYGEQILYDDLATVKTRGVTTSDTPDPTPLLRSPDHVLIGSRNPDRQAAFWVAMGFEVTGRSTIGPLRARSYGVPEGGAEITLTVPGASAGGIRIVATDQPEVTVGSWDRGPFAVDLYTRDMDRSLDMAVEAGAVHRGRMVYEFGIMRLEEGKTTGPDGVRLVFISNSTRRPSVLDSDPGRLHSEVHSIVNIVDSVDAFSAGWHTGAGLTVLGDAVISSPGLADLMELPKVVSARMGLYCDSGVAPIRYEALEFIGLAADDVSELVPQWPLRPGQPLGVFVVDDFDVALLALDENGFAMEGDVREDSVRSAMGVDVCGIRFEIRAR